MHSWSRQTCEMQEKAAMRQTFKKKKFARQLHISEACRSGCKLHLERSPPMPILTAAACDCGEATNGKSVAEAGRA
jgi:hypothetical protein